MHTSTLKTALFLALSATVLLFSCKDDDEDPKNCLEVNGQPSLWADIDGEYWCADNSVLASLSGSVTVNGQSIDLSTLVLEIDDHAVGTYEIDLGRNAVLYVENSVGFEPDDNNPGELVISAHNETTNLLEGSFSVVLRNPQGETRSLDGGFTLSYTE